MKPNDPLPSEDTLFEHAACGLLMTDANGVILRVNATFCRWLGYEANQLLTRRRVQDLFTVGGRLFHQTHCIPLLQMQGSVAEVQLEMLRQDRSRVPVLVNIVRQRQGEVVFDQFAVFIATDRRSYEQELRKARVAAEAALAARLEAEEKLQEANRQLSLADRRKDEFLATLAHELRNPLSPMRNVLDLLKLKLADEPAHVRVLSILERQLKQMTHLVDDLMDVARITEGRMELRLEVLDLGAVMQSAAADMQAAMAAASHRFEVQLPTEKISVKADATRLIQVITNLLTNAAKYTPEGGAVSLRGWRDAGEAVIQVNDTGIGIPAESLATVFDMFSQLTPALERSKGGLGIGLALGRGVLALHGGSIRADSEGPGKGSQFTVRLPLAEEAQPCLVEQVRNVALRLKRVLLIDDNVDAAQVLSMTLELLGYDTRVAHDAMAGLRLGAGFMPQAVLLDIGLPGMNGYEAARRLRSESWGRDLLLIATTGWGQEADKQAAREAGFDFHLTKPIDLERLQALLSAETRS